MSRTCASIKSRSIDFGSSGSPRVKAKPAEVVASASKPRWRK
jgi:hypothetical protein